MSESSGRSGAVKSMLYRGLLLHKKVNKVISPTVQIYRTAVIALSGTTVSRQKFLGIIHRCKHLLLTFLSQPCGEKKGWLKTKIVKLCHYPSILSTLFQNFRTVVIVNGDRVATVLQGSSSFTSLTYYRLLDLIPMKTDYYCSRPPFLFHLSDQSPMNPVKFQRRRQNLLAHNFRQHLRKEHCGPRTLNRLR